MSRLTRDGTAEPVSRDQILRHERGQGNIHFSCSADHVQDWQPYMVDPCFCYMCDHTYIYTYIHTYIHTIQYYNVCCVFFPSILDIKFVRRTSRGHTGRRSHRIFHPPSFCGACLNFSREKDPVIPFPRRKAGLTLKRCSQLAAFAIQPVS